jgi:hypothetical protein
MRYVVLIDEDARIADWARPRVRKGVEGDVPKALSSPLGER